MTRRVLAILILSAVMLTGCGGGDKKSEPQTAKQSMTADEAYKQLSEARRASESTEDKLALTKEFLKTYPESKRTAYSLYAVFYYQGEELGDKVGAITYIETIRKNVKDPEIAKDVDKSMLGFYGDAGMTAKMTSLAEQLAAGGNLDFDDHWTVIEGAVSADEWKLVRKYCAGAKKLTTPEVYKAEQPDRELTAEEIEEAVNDRKGKLLVKDGWARANMGEVDEALKSFAKADPLIPRYYFDIPEYGLNIYWGKTLLMKKEYKGAIKQFARSALVMRNEDALEGLKKAYAGSHGGESGYDEYAEKLHYKIATIQKEFEMPDYAGKRHSFKDLQGDVTLVTLWFPT